MNTKAIVAFLLAGVAAVVIIVARRGSVVPGNPVAQSPEANASEYKTDWQPARRVAEQEPLPKVAPRPALENANAPAPGPTNLVGRLELVRKTFRALAAGNPTNALEAAKGLTAPNERETALLTLVTEWTQGALSPPQERAWRISTYGLEAGLGMELTKDPRLALLWAEQLTSGEGRTALVEQAAQSMAGSDPAAALALGDQMAPDQHSNFFTAFMEGWATVDTDAALNWAGQLTDPGEQSRALQAIHSRAPVGIGAALGMQEGYPVVNELVPGAPAELSGQLHAGDRIVGLAQGDSSFVATQGLALADVVQMVRGEPGTQLQLQILPADAPPGSLPQTISIFRDQLRYKR